jgi:hypothetical protein
LKPSADDRVRSWLRTQVRSHVPLTSEFLHYRDCPLLVVEYYYSRTQPLSDVTSDDYTEFSVPWGCEHSAIRMNARIDVQGTLAELITTLAAQHPDYRLEPFYSTRYPAPEGTLYVPDPA